MAVGTWLETLWNLFKTCDLLWNLAFDFFWSTMTFLHGSTLREHFLNQEISPEQK